MIGVKDLRKTFKVYKRGQGVLEAVKSLFSREYTIKDALKKVSLEEERLES